MPKERISIGSPSRFLLFLLCLFAIPAHATVLEVIEVEGAVKLRFDEVWQTPTAGMVVSLPATVSTGSDGSIKLEQNGTVITVASQTALDLIADADTGQVLQRVVQEKGSAFYDVAPQGSNRFRVESQYLVAVVKGTQFNVTATADESTVALFEGHLQIDAPDVGDSVEIFAGEIARRHRDDDRIIVLDMENDQIVDRGSVPPTTLADSARTGGGDHSDASTSSGSAGKIVTNWDSGRTSDSDDAAAASGDSNAGAGAAAGNTSGDTAINADTGAQVGAVAATASAGSQIDASGAGINVGVNAGGIDADANVELGLSLAAASVDAGVDIGLGAAGITASADIGLSADLINGSIDAGADIDLGAGDIMASADIDVGADLVDGSVDVGADIDLGAGDIMASADIDVGADLTDGSVDVGADIDAGIGDIVAGPGIDVGADLDDGGIDAGLDSGDVAGNADLDVGADLGDGGIDIDLGGNGADLDIGIGTDDTDDILTGGGDTDIVDDVIDEVDGGAIPAVDDLFGF